MPLPLRFTSDDVQVLIGADDGFAPLRAFFLHDLGADLTSIATTKTRLGGDPFTPWDALYRRHRLGYDGSAVRVEPLDGGTACELHPATFSACLEGYLGELQVVQHRRTMERIEREGAGTARFTPTRALPVSFHTVAPGQVLCLPEPGNEILAGLFGGGAEMTMTVGWLLAELDAPGARPAWPGRFYQVEVDGDVAAVEAFDGARQTLDTETFRQALASYQQALIDSHHDARPAAPGPDAQDDPPAEPAGDPVARTLGLGGSSPTAMGWGLVRTDPAMLAETAGLSPHSRSCVPRGAAATGTGAYWADLAVPGPGAGRPRGGTKTFLPPRIGGAAAMAAMTRALTTSARPVAGIPGAWSGMIEDVPVHGYLARDRAGALPVAGDEAGAVAATVEVFFPVLYDTGVDPEVLAAFARDVAGCLALTGHAHVLTAFLLHDVQSHLHHIEVVQAAGPGWEHSGNACHLVLGARTVRLEHLWLRGDACELPAEQFMSLLEAYAHQC